MASPIERSFFASAGSSGGRVIPTPFQFFSTGEDNIRVISVNAKVGVALKINMRFVDNAGTITATSWDHTPNTDRTVNTTDQALGQGAVMNLTVFASAGAPNVGQTFVIVQLIRGLGAGAIVLGTLLQGYVTSTQALGWPGSPIVSSTEGEPNVRNIVGTAPAAGVNLVETCPAGARWELMTVFFFLSTNANPGTRTPTLEIISAGQVFQNLTAGVGVVASTLQFFDYGQTLLSVGLFTPALAYMTIPARQFLRAGDSFATTCLGLQATDVFSAPNYQVREWLEAA